VPDAYAPAALAPLQHQRQVEEDVTAIEAALAGRRAASAGDDTTFVDADIAFHAAVVAAAHNPVLADLFTEFAPVLREGLAELLTLTGLRTHDPNTADDAHAALARAVAEGDAQAAAEILRAELEDPFGGGSPTSAVKRRAKVTRSTGDPE
jgi:GntR family transcriptional repressor for pyruvate dehydrogenase complex